MLQPREPVALECTKVTCPLYATPVSDARRTSSDGKERKECKGNGLYSSEKEFYSVVYVCTGDIALAAPRSNSLCAMDHMHIVDQEADSRVHRVALAPAIYASIQARLGLWLDTANLDDKYPCTYPRRNTAGGQSPHNTSKKLLRKREDKNNQHGMKVTEKVFKALHFKYQVRIC